MNKTNRFAIHSSFGKTFAARLTGAVAALLLAPSLMAGDVPEKAAACAACHGEGGAKPILPEYPILAGQYSNFIAQALKDYKTGARKNPVMSAQAATLSDDEIEALALYFFRQDGPLYTPRIEH